MATILRRKLAVLHPNTRILLDEWRLRREDGLLPRRTALSPAAFGSLLPQVFVLGLDAGEDRFRLAGGLVTDLHGRELRGAAFAGLFAGLDRPAIQAALADARRFARPMLLQARGVASNGHAVGLEIPLCPLIGPTDHADRTIGLYQPTGLTARLGGEVIARLHLTGVEPYADEAPETTLAPLRSPSAGAALKLVVDNTRRVA